MSSNTIRIDNAAMPFSRLTNYQLSMELQSVRQAVTEKIENNDFKGAVSYRFSQGLLTLMCNNSKLKADINFFFFLLRRQTS